MTQDARVEAVARAIYNVRPQDSYYDADKNVWHPASWETASPPKIKQCYDMAISALNALPPTLPPGWVAVPEEPTEEMMAAGVIANDKYALEVSPCSGFRAYDCYKAMLSAVKRD